MTMVNLNKSNDHHSIKDSTLEDHCPQELKFPPLGPPFINFSNTVSYEVNLASQS